MKKEKEIGITVTLVGKKRTLKEIANEYKFLNKTKGFILVAKWQQEQDKNKFYCEEFELIKYIQWIIRKIDAGNTPEEIVRLVLFNRDKIEQFKKK